MSYDLAVWKRSPRTKTAMLYECYDAIIEGSDHEAMDCFDTIPFFDALAVTYGPKQDQYFGDDVDDCPFLFSEGGAEHGNWILFHLNWSTHQETTNTIIHHAVVNGLMVYDPQKKGVYGNKRPKPAP